MGRSICLPSRFDNPGYGPDRRYMSGGLTSPSIHSKGHFGHESFQTITCTGTDNLTRTTKRNTPREKKQRKNDPMDKHLKSKPKTKI